MEHPGNRFIQLCCGILGIVMAEKHMLNLVCYCFGYTRQDIKQDFIKHSRSTIMEKIAAEKKMGTCECTTKNPSGR
jgi:hypothetical protein